MLKRRRGRGQRRNRKGFGSGRLGRHSDLTLALKYTPVAVALLKEVPSQVKKHTHGSYIASIMRIP